MPKATRGHYEEAVLAILKARPGMYTTKEQIERDTGLNVEQVRNAVSRLRLRGLPIQQTTRGGAYIYGSEADKPAVTRKVTQEEDRYPFHLRLIGTSEVHERIFEDPKGGGWAVKRIY